MSLQDVADRASTIAGIPSTRGDNPPLDLRRNMLAFGGDSMLWGIGSYFIPLDILITSRIF